MRRFAGSSLAPPGAVLGIAVLARIVLDVPTGILVQGALVGGLTSLLALGLVLVWRANRVINFAAGDLGAVPGTLAVLLAVSTVGLGWWAALGVGLVASLLLGIVVHRVVIERFARGPRLVLAAATIGLAQLLASAALFLPRAFSLPGGRLPAPFDASITISPITFHGADVVAVTVIPLVFVALATFLTRTTTGIAVRAGAERSDRLATLGIPLRRIHTVVWAIAAVLAFLAVYLRAGIVGLPLGEVLGPALLLRALAAAVIGRMERLRVVAAAAVALGVVEQAVSWHWREPAYVDPILFVVVVVALLVTRRRAAREPEDSSWEAVREVRPIPRALSRLPEVRATRVAIGVGLVTVLVAVPLVLTPSRTNLAAAILLFGIVGLSLVVLTGWAGQVSLGQVAFVAIGAAVGGAVTDRLGWDLALGVLLAGLAGAAVALVIGLPALRRRGLTLTVTSLALALATSGWLLNRRFFGPGTDLDWLPGDRIARVPLFGAIGVHSETRFYYLCLIALGLAYAAVRGIRASRTGRVLIAGRDDDRATQAVGVHTARTTLFAFAASGFLAAFAGALFVHHQSGLTAGPYRPEASLEVFSMAVIGGLGSAPGVLLGAAFVRSTDFFLAAEWRILATGVGLLAVLAVLPGGLGGGIADARDAWLRRVARRRGIELPGAAAPDIVPTAETQGMSAPAPTTALLALDALEVALGGVSVVRGVSLHVEPGEIVALLGTNGAGKSTVLRAIAGLLPAATGSVRLGGREITGMRPESIAAMGIASAPGGVGVFPSLSVAEHLRLGAWCVRDDPDGTAASDALARFPELAERMATPAGDLSGGQQQMLNLAMALVARPRLLLLDELSLGLSPALVTRLLGAVRELAARGTTVLLVEQSVTLALQVATRAYFLEKGTIRFVGPTKELLERDDLVRAVVLAEAPERAPARAPRARPRASGVRLSVRSVSRHFGGIVALDSVSFDVHDREILGILGPNGAGKTTLFDVLSGFVEPESGEIALHGTEGSGPPLDLHRCSAPTRAQRGLGRTFQTARLFPALTVAEAAAVACEDIVAVRDPIAAALGLPAVRRSEADVEVQVTTMLERFGLDTHRDLFVRELSMGQRRVLSLACALASAPRVLLLDEPSAGITTAETASMAQVLLDIRDDLDVSLVIIEHDLALLRTVADRLLALDVGTVIAEGPPESVLQDPAVVASYLGSPS